MADAPSFRSDFLRTQLSRGAYAAATEPEALDALLRKGPVPAYIGFDCTGPSLHVGSLIQIMTLRRLQQAGHKPIVLMGGGTTRIGDPSGKDETRKLLSDERIEANKKSIFRIFARFLKFGDGPTDAVMVDNADWLDKLEYIPFLREVGRHFSVNQMLTRDAVKLRLERDQPLSFLEFNYMVLQAYDFVELYRRTGCRLECGGSDQWGNIVSGTDLGRRLENVDLYGLTSPLLTTASGAKMGKTAKGAVWLNEDMLSAYDYWQFWRNSEDADVVRFLNLFTELPENEIAKLAALKGAELNEAKKILATEATTLAHGRAAAEQAAGAAKRAFEEGAVSADLPVKTIEKTGDGANAVALLVAAGIAATNSDARRKVAEKAVRVDGTLVVDPLRVIPYPQNGAFKVQYGKKKIVLVKPA